MQFLVDGGIALAEYDLVQMTLDVIVWVIQQKFLNWKCPKFVAKHSLHNYVNFNKYLSCLVFEFRNYNLIA